MTPIDRVGKDAAVLSAVEIGLGSLLHAFQVPLGGHLLSLNQIFLLARGACQAQAAGENVRNQPFQVSSVAAVLKSLSPAGKKLTPMLAISMQGLLFSGGTAVFGARLPALMFGAALAGLWAFAQPLLIAWLLFGNTAVQLAGLLYDRSQEWFHFGREDLVVIGALLLSLKTVASVLAALAARVLPPSAIDRYVEKLLAAGSAQRRDRLKAPAASTLRAHARGALKDLAHPLFLVSVALSVVFLAYAESETSALIWGLLRPLAVGFLLFFAARAVPLSRIPGSFGKSVASALRSISDL